MWSRTISLIVFALAICTPMVGDAGKPDDFKVAADNADKRKGCDSIPYGSDRGSCKGSSGRVEKYCKTDAFSCKSMGTKGLVENIERMKKAVDSHKSKGEDQKAKELQKKIDEMQKKLDSDRADIQKRLEMATGCLTSRKAVRTLFANVTSKVKGEREEELKSHVDKLVRYYESERGNHDIAIKNAENAVEICKQTKAGSR